MASDLRSILASLSEADVDFVVIGGVAAALHGATRVTQDVDILYERSAANRARLAAFLLARGARPRGDFPPDLPFLLDATVLDRTELLTLTTADGFLDVFQRIPGVGTFEDALAVSQVVEIDGERIAVLGLDALILAKEATDRPRDREALPELRALAAIRDASQHS